MSMLERGVLFHKARSSVKWTFWSQVIRQVEQFTSTAVLARLIVPQEFGIVSMAFVFIGFLQLFTDMGFGPALIRQESLTDELIATCFWLSILFGIVLVVVCVPLNPVVGRVYQMKEVGVIFFALSLNFPLLSLSTVQQALLEKDLNFKFVSLTEISSSTVGTVGSIVLALTGFGVWSLVGRVVLSSLVKAILMMSRARFNGLFHFRLGSLRDVWGFSFFLFGFNLINYTSRNTDNLLVGKFLGATPLAFYNLAYQLMLYPLTYITWLLSRVMYPVFVKFQNDVSRFREVYLQTTRLIAFISFPLTLGLNVVAPEFVVGLLGPKWVSAVPLIRILAGAGLLQSIGSLVGNIYQTLNKMRYLFIWSVLATLLTVESFVIGLRWGITGVALAYALATLILTSFNFQMALPFIESSLFHLVRSIWRSLAASLGMACILGLVRLLLTKLIDPIVAMLVEVALGAMIYFILSLLLNRKDVRLFLSVLPKSANRFIPRLLMESLG